MLNDKNDNRFLNALNDIDDDLIEEIAEVPVEPEIIPAAPKKSRFIRFVAPAAALAIVSVVGIGALIVGRNVFSPWGGGNTTVTESEPASSGTEQSNSQIGTVTDSNDTTPFQTTSETIPSPNGVLPRPISEVDIPNINGYSVDFDVPHDGIVTSVLFDTKICGDYTFSLYGSGVFTDFENASENIIFAHSLTVMVEKDNELIDFHDVYNPLDPNAPVFMLMKDHLDSYTEIVDFGQKLEDFGKNEEYIIIFRSLKGNVPFPEVMFFFVNDEGMHECKRGDLALGADRAERSEALSLAITTGIDNNESYDNFIICDRLTGVTYTFDNINPDGYAYYCEGRRKYPWGTDSYWNFDPDSIPVIDEFTYDEVGEVIDKLIPKTVITEQKVGDYTLSLVGENMWKNSEGVIYLYNPQTVISKNGDYIGSVNTTLPIMNRYKAYLMYSNTGSYDHYGVNGYMFGDTLLIIDHGLLDASYFGSGCFYAYNGGIDRVVNSLAGYWPGMSIDESPAWTAGKQGQELTVDTENQTVIYGFQKYTFDLSVIPAMYNYTVSWIEEPVE